MDGEHMYIIFYLRKLKPVQKNYTMMEKEILPIIETVTRFCHILLWFLLHILSDHKNFSINNFAYEHVRRCRLILKKYYCVFKYIPWKQNIIADFLSKC